MYLTLAPYGGNLEGVRAAVAVLFRQGAGRADRRRGGAAGGPAAVAGALRPDRQPAAAHRRADRVLDRMASARHADAGRRGRGGERADPAPGACRPPLDAPHLAERLRAAAPGRQRDREPHRRRSAAPARGPGAPPAPGLEAGATLAILVVGEFQPRRCAPMSAPADYFDTGSRGQNDMVRAIRSPGSTLKPFIYGLAFDDLLIHPETIVTDRADALRRLRAAEFRSSLPRRADGARGAAALAQPAGGGAARPGRAAALRRSLPRGRRAAACCPIRASAPGLPIALGGVGIEPGGSGDALCRHRRRAAASGRCA